MSGSTRDADDPSAELAGKDVRQPMRSFGGDGFEGGSRRVVGELDGADRARLARGASVPHEPMNVEG